MANLKVVDADVLEADLTSVADKIRAKTGGEEKLAFPSGFESALDTIESADSALAEVEYAMSKGYTDYSYFFAYKNYSSTRIPVELIRHTSNATNFSYMFMSSSSKEIPAIDTSSGTNFRGMYYNCGGLKSIKGVNLTNATNVTEMFRQIDYVEEIIFNGVIKISGLELSYCAQLTHDSLMSAINALYDYASEGSTKTYKLVLGSTNLAKLTDAEKAIATQRGWTLA